MDHIGNAKYIIKNINVLNVIFNCGNYNKLENELIDEFLKYKIIYYERTLRRIRQYYRIFKNEK